MIVLLLMMVLMIVMIDEMALFCRLFRVAC